MKRLLVVVVTFSLAAPLAAQTKNEVFAFFDDPSASSTETQGTKFTTGYGLALRHFSSPRVSTELSIARHYQYGVYFASIAPGSSEPTLGQFRARVVPVDLISSYHFAPDSFVQPYLGAGVHHVFTFDGPGLGTQTRFELAGGVAFRVTDHFFIRADGKRLLGGSALTYDPSTRGGLGFSWRF